MRISSTFIWNCRKIRIPALRAAPQPTAVSVDEFKGNSGGQKYHSIVVDPENKKVLDILPNRYESDFVKYFAQFPNKNDVKFLICDMNPHFRNVTKICLPNAMIVADRYHVVRQVYWAMEQLALMLEIAPRLADAYRLKNEFLSVIRTKFSAVGKQRLKDWLFSVELMGMPEFDDCVRAYRNWFWEILNSMDVPWSNGFFEGCNNKTKVLKRVCFGLRNFSNFRKRILNESYLSIHKNHAGAQDADTT